MINISKTFVVKKEDVKKVRDYGNKNDWQIRTFPITRTPRMRKIQAVYIGRSDFPSKIKNSEGFNNDLKNIRIYLP